MKKKINRVYLVAVLIVVIAISGAVYYGYNVVYKERKQYQQYQQAFELYKSGEYESAEEILLTIKGYEGVSVLLKDISYRKACGLFEDGDYEGARELFSSISDYQDSLDYEQESTYLLAVDAYTVQDYDQAEIYFEEISGYKDADTYIEDITFYNLKESFQAGFYMECEADIFKIPDYPGVEPYGIVVLEEQGKAAYEAQQYERSIEMFKYAAAYSDWLDIYNAMPAEEKSSYAAICGETDFKQRLRNIKSESELAEREYQAVLCVKELVKYYENEKQEIAELAEVDEVRFAEQTYSNNAQVPVVMISYKEKTSEKKKEQQYAVYNETDLYGICPSLKNEEIDKSDSNQLQTYIKLSGLWDMKDTIKLDMARIKKAMGWE